MTGQSAASMLVMLRMQLFLPLTLALVCLQRIANAAVVAAAPFPGQLQRSRHLRLEDYAEDGNVAHNSILGGLAGAVGALGYQDNGAKLTIEHSGSKLVRMLGPIDPRTDSSLSETRSGPAQEFANAPVAAAAQMVKQQHAQQQQDRARSDKQQVAPRGDSASGVGAAVGAVSEGYALSRGRNEKLRNTGLGISDGQTEKPASDRSEHIHNSDAINSTSSIQDAQREQQNRDILRSHSASGVALHGDSREQPADHGSSLGSASAPSALVVSCDKGECLDLGTDLVSSVEGPACRSLLLTGKCPKACASALQEIVQHPSWPVCASTCRKDVVEGAAERWSSMCLEHTETLLDQGKDVVKSIVGHDALHTIGAHSVLRILVLAFMCSIAVAFGYRRGAATALRIYRSRTRRHGISRKMSDPELNHSGKGLQAASSV